MRVVIAKDYNRSLARPLLNCPDCFEQKEQQKRTGQPCRQGSEGKEAR
jgi:hypothetical protein